MSILKKGDILEVRNLGYAHYAVVVDYADDKVTVVNVQPDDERGKKGAKVGEEVYNGFLVGYLTGLYHRANELDDKYKPYPPDEIVRRARSKIGLWDYNLFGNNCEHFSNWCRYGIEFSSQSGGGGKKENMSTGGRGGSVTLGPVRAGYGGHGTVGIRSQNDSDGFRQAIVAEAKYAQVDIGRARATAGLSATTGVNASADGVGYQVLGTGVQVGRETKISIFGSSVGIRWW